MPHVERGNDLGGKKDRSEIVTFFRQKSKRAHEQHTEKRQPEARETKGMK